MVANKLYNYKVIVEVYNKDGNYLGESVMHTIAHHCSVAAQNVEGESESGRVYAVDVFRVGESQK